MIKTRFVIVFFRTITLVLIPLFTFSVWLLRPFPTFAVEGQIQSTWRRFTGKDEEFSVLMPGEPVLYINEITNNSDKHPLERIYSSYSKGSVYLVVSYDKEGDSVKDTLENFRRHHPYQGEATFERDVIIDNFKGKQYRFTLNGAVGMVQCYVTKKHAYAIAIVQANDDPPLREYFFSSLSLIKNGSNSTTNTSKGNGGAQGPPENQTSDLSKGDRDTNNATANAVFTPKEVTHKAVVVSRPEPLYTEEGKNGNVSGKVVLRAVLSASGEVTNIRAVSGLPKGLTEKAIEAARHLKFIPAIKDGRFVSQYIQIEYNFSLY